MTKIELLKMIDDSTLKCDVSTAELYAKYYPLIKRTLCFCADSVVLEGFSSLAGFEKRNAFEKFIRDSKKDAIEDRLKALITDLDTFSSQYIVDHPDKVKSAGEVMFYQNELHKIGHKFSKIIFTILFVIFSSAVIVFAALDAGNVFVENTPMAKTCAIVAAVSGALDFVCGIAFYIYGRHDDKNKKDIAQAAEQAIADDRAKDFIDHPTVHIVVLDKSKRKFKMSEKSTYVENNYGPIDIT